MSFPNPDPASAITMQSQDEGRLIVKIVMVIALVCASAVLLGS